MNIEVANRLCELRKSRNLSQEQLAEKLGVSRQAVSKWERAEASPDTDNLIALAEVYDVSIDEILTGKSRTPKNNDVDDDGGGVSESIPENEEEEAYKSEDDYRRARVSFGNGININDDNAYVHVGFDGIHVEERNGTRVRVGTSGVFVDEKGDTKVYTDEDGNVIYKGFENESFLTGVIKNICIPIVAIIIFLIWGFSLNAWYIAWIVFLAVPVLASLIEAIEKRKPHRFCYPVLVVIAYMICGLGYGVWHPTWVLFLTIPIFYSICGVFKKRKF